MKWPEPSILPRLLHDDGGQIDATVAVSRRTLLLVYMPTHT